MNQMGYNMSYFSHNPHGNKSKPYSPQTITVNHWKADFPPSSSLKYELTLLTIQIQKHNLLPLAQHTIRLEFSSIVLSHRRTHINCIRLASSPAQKPKAPSFFHTTASTDITEHISSSYFIRPITTWHHHRIFTGTPPPP